MSVLITGGTGFVGQALVKRLGIGSVRLSSRGDGADLNSALVGITTVVHLAARVHIVEKKEADPLTAFCNTRK